MIDKVIANAFLAGAPIFAILRSRDLHTHEHCARVARLAWYTGIQFGFNEDQQNSLIHASVLHDVGKVGIPDSILLDDENLDILQVDTIQRHSEIGASIVEKLDLPQSEKTAELVRWHHEREDGKGYPDGLAAEQIPVGAQIISVVDVFDALTSHRRYRPAVGPGKAIEMLEAEIGAQFNADVVNAFRVSYQHKGENIFMVR